MSDLIACPFCGSDKIDPEGWSDGEGKAGPACDECGATAESAEAWNRRTDIRRLPNG